jgi:hypothetical protein
MTRQEHLKLIASLSKEIRESIAVVIETADAQGDWNWNGEDSVYSDDIQSTLSSLANEIRVL